MSELRTCRQDIRLPLNPLGFSEAVPFICAVTSPVRSYNFNYIQLQRTCTQSNTPDQNVGNNLLGKTSSYIHKINKFSEIDLGILSTALLF